MPHEPARPPEDPDGYVVECPPPPRELSLPDVAERLMAEFGGRVDLATITRAVLDCRRDLQGVPPGALPELLERHARQHLLLLPPAAIPAGADRAGVGLAGDPGAAATGPVGR